MSFDREVVVPWSHTITSCDEVVSRNIRFGLIPALTLHHLYLLLGPKTKKTKTKSSAIKHHVSVVCADGLSDLAVVKMQVLHAHIRLAPMAPNHNLLSIEIDGGAFH